MPHGGHFFSHLEFEHKLIHLLQTNQHLKVFCGLNSVKNRPDKSIPSTIRVSGIRFTFGGHFGRHLELCKNAQVCHSCHLANGQNYSCLPFKRVQEQNDRENLKVTSKIQDACQQPF